MTHVGPRQRRTRYGMAFAVTFALAFVGAWSLPASANWLTTLIRESGDAAGRSARHGVDLPHRGVDIPGPVGRAARHLSLTPDAPKASLAAHATPEGHWEFVNRDGKTFTAGTPDEIERAAAVLLSKEALAAEPKVTLFLSEDSVFSASETLDKLGDGRNLNVVTRDGAYALKRTVATTVSKQAAYRAQVRPNLLVDMADQAGFDEAVSYLSRPLNRANIRTIAVETGGNARLTSAPLRDPASKLPQVDRVDPAHLESAFSSVRGQSVVLVGSVDKGAVTFGGAREAVNVDRLVAAARANDVNLVLLHTDAGLQPGGRNWLWQAVDVKGLDDAAQSTTFADFLEAIAAKRGGFEISAVPDNHGRVYISAIPSPDATGVVADANNWMQDVVGHLTGKMVSAAVDIHARDKSEQKERDLRLIPGIPAFVQWPYFVSLIAGLVGFATTASWWARIWPPSAREEGTSRIVHWLKQLPRAFLFLALFAPLVGIPALAVHSVRQVWAIVSAPFRWLRRLFSRAEI